jgi:hypothetical protein
MDNLAMQQIASEWGKKVHASPADNVCNSGTASFFDPG